MSAKHEIHEKLFLTFSILVVVTLPFSIKLNGLSMILLSINWIVEGKWRAKYEMLKGNRIALLFVGLYLVHIVGLIHTQNYEQAFSELEKKVAFLIFPVIFATTTYLDKPKISKILNYFVGACLVAAVICVINGLYCYIRGDASYLFYHKLGAVINFDHAIYFSFYIGICVFYMLVNMVSRWPHMDKTRRILFLAIVIFFLFFLILLSSKTLLVTVFLLVIFFIGRLVFYNKGTLIGAASIGLCFLLFASILFTVPNVKNRFQEVFIDEYDQTNPLFLDDYAHYHFTGGAIRLAIWKMTFEIINQEKAWLWGVGTGDSQDELTATYVDKHVYGGDPVLGIKGFLHYNAHNQFLQFYLMFGFTGLVLFIYILIRLFKFALTQSPFLLYLLLLFFAFSLTESTLHVQKGIVPFLFLTSLLSSRPPAR